MLGRSKENSEATPPAAIQKTGIINQWGGKLAFFFTYTHLSHDLATGLTVALMPFIRQDLGLTYLQAGLLASAYSLTAGLSQILGGWLSDRLTRKKSLAIGLGGVGLSSVVLGFAPSYYVMLPILVVMGVLAGFYHPSAVSTLTHHFAAERRGRVFALHMLGGSLGFGLGPVLGAIIASTLNWHLAFMLLSIPVLIAAFLALTRLKLETLPKQPASTTAAKVTSPKPMSLLQVFRSTAGIMAISVAMQLVTGPLLSFVPLFLVDVHHLPAAAGSMWVAIIRIGGLAGSLFGGWLSDKWGRRNTIFLSLALFGPVVFLLATLPFGVGLAAVFVLFGWLMSMRETTMQTYLMDSAPPQLRATVFGIYFGFGQEGSSIVQPIAGDVMDSMGIDSVYGGISLITVGLSAAALILAYVSSKRTAVQRTSTD